MTTIDTATEGTFRAEEFWLKKLASVMLETPLVFHRPPAGSDVVEPYVAVPRDLGDTVARFAGNSTFKEYVLFAAALHVAVYKHTNVRSLLLATTDVDNYDVPEDEQRLLYLHTKLSGNMLIRDLIGDLQNQLHEAVSHQHFRFQNVLNALSANTTVRHETLFQTSFVYDGFNRTVKTPHAFDLQIELEKQGGEYRLTYHYRDSVFDDSFLSTFCRQIVHALANLVNHFDDCIADISVLTDDDRHILFDKFNTPLTLNTAPPTIPALFNIQAKRRPAHPAVVFGEETLTYDQLNRRANRLANYLRLHYGVVSNTVVAVMMRRSPDLIVAILGIIKSGAAYLPIDPEYPAERVHQMLADAHPTVVVVEADFIDLLGPTSCAVLPIDIELGMSEFADTDPDAQVLPTDLAYIIYTSGSSGTPKGVMIEHRSVANLVAWQADVYCISADTRVGQLSSFSFDASVGETFMALLNGITCVMLDRSALDPQQLVMAINRHTINVLVTVPSLLRTINPDEITDGYDLTVVSVGEECESSLAERWSRRCQFINAYGPTEYTVYSHLWKRSSDKFDAHARLPIGRPMLNTVSYILDNDLELAPIGAVGELYLSGAGIARGYLNAPLLSAKKFILNRFALTDNQYDERVSIHDFYERRKRLLGMAKLRADSPTVKNYHGPASCDGMLAAVRDLPYDIVECTRRILTEYQGKDIKQTGFYRYFCEGQNETYTSFGLCQDDLRELFSGLDMIGSSGVDFGFGNSEQVTLLAEMGARITGIDYSPFMVSRARASGINAYMARIDAPLDQFEQHLPFPRESQDFVLSTLTLDRLEHPYQFLQNFFASLKPHGRFALQVLLPVVPRDDGNTEHPITYTAPADAIGEGNNAAYDKWILLTILDELGGKGFTIRKYPYCVSSSDGIQNYLVWSISGYKRSANEMALATSPPLRLYKTGDLARYLPNGDIEFLGRRDNQVKLHGVRIELEEIEILLLENPSVAEACVVVRSDNNHQSTQLVAFIVTRVGVLPTDIRDFLASRLPHNLIPSRIIQVDRLPRLLNGKVDRSLLPSLDINDDARKNYRAPQTPAEKAISGAFEELFGIKQVGIDDSFFELGGDSISALQAISRLRTLGYSVEVAQIFLFPKVSDLAMHMHASVPSLLLQTQVYGSAPLTGIQADYFSQYECCLHHHNQAVKLIFPQRLVLNALDSALDMLYRHHDALRTTFRRDENRNVTQFFEGGDFQIPFGIVDFRGIVLDQTDQARLSDSIQESLHLFRGPTSRIVLLRFEEEDQLLAVIHHLLIDVVSWNILLVDFANLYQKLSRNKPAQLPDKTTSYKVWTEYLDTQVKTGILASELDYWTSVSRTVAQNRPAPSEDRNRETSLPADLHTAHFELTSDDTARLLRSSHRAYNTGILDLLLTALARGIRRWYPKQVPCIALETHGRDVVDNSIDLARTIGWFTAIFPLALQVDLSNDIGKDIKAVKEAIRRVPSNGANYLTLKNDISSVLAHELDFPCTPLICFNYLGQLDQGTHDLPFQVSHEALGRVTPITTPRVFALELIGSVRNEVLSFALHYDHREYTHATIQSVLQYFKEELISVIEHCVQQENIILTPSDVSLKTISVSSLDTLQAFYDVEDVAPLLPIQLGMYFHSILDPAAFPYYVQISYKLRGHIDIAAFSRSLDLLVERHASLRSVIDATHSDHPLCLVLKSLPPDFSYEDFRSIAQDVTKLNAHLAHVYRENRTRYFDLSRGPLIRVALFQLAEDEYQVIWSHHHIIIDGWSAGILYGELLEIYAALVNNRTIELPRPTGYREYLRKIELRDERSACDFWSSYLDGYDRTARFPSFGYTVTGDDESLAMHSFLLSRDLSEQLSHTAKHANVTYNTLIEVIWGILLQKYNSAPDVVFGAVLSGRKDSDDEYHVGIFVNTIPVRVTEMPYDNFSTLLQRYKVGAITRLAHDHLSLKTIEMLHKRRHRLFSHIITFQNQPSGDRLAELFEEHRAPFNVTDVELNESRTNYDFVVEVIPGGQLGFRFTYNPGKYASDDMIHVQAHLTQLCQTIVANPEVRLSSISVTSNSDDDYILHRLSRGDCPTWSPQKTVVQQFELHAKHHPDAHALTFDGHGLTYGELNNRANRLARFLQKKWVVGQEDRIGIVADLSPQTIVGILAVLKAGAAYVPLEAEQPIERAIAVFEQLKLNGLLTNSKYRKNFGFYAGNIFDFEQLDMLEEGDSNLRQSADLQNTAYVLFTSGSTGVPKGVMITHFNLSNYIEYANQRYYQDTEVRTVPLFTALTFDLTVTSLFCTLTQGKTLQLFSGYELPSVLSSCFDGSSSVDVVKLTPSHISVFSELAIPSTKVSTVITGGEPLTKQNTDCLFSRNPNMKIYNEYGPTETTVGCIEKCIDSRDPYISIGRPIANTDVYVLDRHMNTVPIGIPGELYVGGAGVARGYINKPGLTAEKFVPHPFSASGERLYRTGDRVRFRTNGDLEFLGRIDQQIKVRGFRVELGEIEFALSQHPAVHSALVLADQVDADSHNEVGSHKLVAYVSVRKDLATHVGGYRRYILPNNMAIAQINDYETDFVYRDVYSEQRYLRHGITLKDGGCVLDVGANVGLFSLFVTQQYPNTSVYAFEPIPQLFNALQINLGLYGKNSQPLDIGLSNKAGKRQFVYYPNWTSHSGCYADTEQDLQLVQQIVANGNTDSLPSTRAGSTSELLQKIPDKQIINCKINTLSCAMAEARIQHVDLLKITVHKSELDVLDGIAIADWPKILQVVVEVYDIGDRLNQVMRILSNVGFHVVSEKKLSFGATDVVLVYATRTETSISPSANMPQPTLNVMGADHPNQLLVAEDLRHFLQKRLPDYMIPHAYEFIDAFPLTRHGKIDRFALPSLESLPKRYVAPTTDVERQLQAMWQEVLRIPAPGIEDDFFALGGHSLVATQIAVRIRVQYLVDIPLRYLFEHRTIKELALIIEEAVLDQIENMEDHERRARESEALARSPR